MLASETRLSDRFLLLPSELTIHGEPNVQEANLELHNKVHPGHHKVDLKDFYIGLLAT